MSVKRQDLVKYFEENGFHLLREGRNLKVLVDDNKKAIVTAFWLDS